jgi:hypothetical protein
MSTNRGAVDVVVTALGHRFGESRGDALPDTGGTPSPKTPVDRVPVAVLLRHVAPGRTGAQPPENAIDDVAIVLGRAPPSALSRFSLNRQQNPQDTPLDLAQIAAAQGCLLESAALNQNEILTSIDFVHAT